MKKFAAVVSVAVLFAFAAPVFAATNPFMDVPMNHWAYDAIGQLAAHGILSGYPDGTYKGKQPTTRYEMASALARALAVVDMTKASKQDVEMLKKLIVEFKDELDALGVKVSDIDGRLKVIEERLGGWKIVGSLRLDIENENNDAPDAENEVKVSRARLIFTREFGDPENPMKFTGRMDSLASIWSRFYVEIPFFWDSTLTAGRFCWDMEEDYYLGGATDFDNTGGFFGLDSYLTDRNLDALGWTKEFGLGSFRAYLAHDRNVRGFSDGRDDPATGWVNEASIYGNWEFMVMAQLQFNEQFGLDLGAQVFWGDNAEPAAPYNNDELKFDSLWTAFAGLRFNFNDSIAFKGIYYSQKIDVEQWQAAGAQWVNTFPDNDNPSAWKLILDVKQEALKFTSLWLEYGQMKQNFTVPAGTNSAVFVVADLGNVMPLDLKYWRIGAGQKWNDKWATHLFYYNYDLDEVVGLPNPDFKEFGLGVQYTYNPNVSFGLNYVKVDYKADGVDDDHVFLFRTQVTF